MSDEARGVGIGMLIGETLQEARSISATIGEFHKIALKEMCPFLNAVISL